MLQLFKPKYHSILGIDITPTMIKAIEISGKGENRCVQGYGIEPLPPNAVDGYAIKDIDAVANSIKRLVMNANLKSKYAVLAVPDSAVISKVLQVNDDLSEIEIEEFIMMEADKYIPFPIEEINIDFNVLGPSPKGAGKLDVLIVASRSENVNSRIEATTKAGLQVKVIDVESYAIERVAELFAKELPSQGHDKVVAVIDIGEEFTNLFVLHGMKLVYTRQDEFGAKQLINDIAQHYGVTQAEAVTMKEQKMPDDYEKAVLEPFTETLFIHIKRALQFFFSTSQQSFVDYILLAGTIDNLSTLAKVILEKTSIPTIIANPMNHLSLASDLHASDVNISSMLIACGLALRHVE